MTFEWPIFLFGLLLLPVLAWLYVLAQRRRRKYTVRFTNLALLQQVAGNGPGIRRHVPPLLYLLGVAALIVSFARPNAVIAVPRDQTTFLLVLDSSGSMSANDLQPTRMDAAKQAAREFIQNVPQGASVGVVTFNNAASAVAAPSREHEQALEAINSIGAGGGTAIGDGLNLALDQIDRVRQGEEQPAPAVVVLLSDGESSIGSLPQAAAERAAQANIVVNTVGIGQRGSRVEIGGQQTAGLDERTLQQIAETTGGQYFYAAEANDLQRIYANLSAKIGFVEERTEVTAIASAIGAVLLLIGGVLALRWFQQFP